MSDSIDAIAAMTVAITKRTTYRSEVELTALSALQAAVNAALGTEAAAAMLHRVVASRDRAQQQLQLLLHKPTSHVNAADLVRSVLAASSEPLSPAIIGSLLVRKGYTINPATIRTALRYGINTRTIFRVKPGKYISTMTKDRLSITPTPQTSTISAVPAAGDGSGAKPN